MGAAINGGYILLARRMLTSGIMEKPPLQLKLWVWMLMQASHTEHGSLKRGQFFTSIERMREAMSYKVGNRIERPSKKKIRISYGWFEAENMIEIARVTHGMLITVLNYDIYQRPDSYEKHVKAMNPESPFRGTPKDTPKGTEDEGETPLFSRGNDHKGNAGGHTEGQGESPLRGTILTRRDNKKGHIAGKPHKRSRPSKQTNPDIRKFMDWWKLNYEQVHGTPYPFDYGKESTLIQGFLKSYSLQRLTDMAGTFLRCDDDFARKNGFTIGVFKGKIPGLALVGAERKERKIIPTAEVLRREEEELKNAGIQRTG